MLKRVFAVIIASILVGCAQPTQTYVPKPAPPGTSTIKSPWIWPIQQEPSEKLKPILEANKTPETMSEYLQKNIPWVERTDGNIFSSPNQFLDRGTGICSDFARLWQYNFNRNGKFSFFVATWAKDSAHAYTIVKMDNQYHLASNQWYYPEDLNKSGEGVRSVLVNAAEFFYGAEDWKETYSFDENGNIRAAVFNQRFDGVMDAPPANPSKLFNIKDR